MKWHKQLHYRVALVEDTTAWVFTSNLKISIIWKCIWILRWWQSGCALSATDKFAPANAIVLAQPPIYNDGSIKKVTGGCQSFYKLMPILSIHRFCHDGTLTSDFALLSCRSTRCNSTMTGMVLVMTLVCLAGTISYLMGGQPINRSCSVWMLPRLPCPPGGTVTIESTGATVK